jgi:hypothetical protein
MTTIVRRQIGFIEACPGCRSGREGRVYPTHAGGLGIDGVHARIGQQRVHGPGFDGEKSRLDKIQFLHPASARAVRAGS